MDAVSLWQVLTLVFGPAGAAWLGVKVSLNGARADIREIKSDVKDLHTEVSRHSERLAVVEDRVRGPK